MKDNKSSVAEPKTNKSEEQCEKTKFKSDYFCLILWNDNVNNMIDVIVALYEVCRLSNERSMEVMLQAHQLGNALAKAGTMAQLRIMKDGMKNRNLSTTIELMPAGGEN